MATGISANRLELLQIADAVAREKSIDKEIVIASIEEAIQKAARSRYGAEHDIRVHIDPKTGEMTIKRCLTVVDTVENEDTEIGLADAKKRDPKAEPGMVEVRDRASTDARRREADASSPTISQRGFHDDHLPHRTARRRADRRPGRMPAAHRARDGLVHVDHRHRRRRR